jgi:hypothetical protein
MSNILKIKNFKFCEKLVKRIPFYNKTTLTTTSNDNNTLASFSENLHSFSYKNNLSYPEPLVIPIYLESKSIRFFYKK